MRDSLKVVLQVSHLVTPFSDRFYQDNKADSFLIRTLKTKVGK